MILTHQNRLFMKKLLLSALFIAGLNLITFAQKNIEVSEEFIQHLIINDYPKIYSLFSTEAKEVINEEDFTQQVSELSNQLGTPKKLHGGTEITENEGDETYNVVYYHVEYEMGDLDYKFIFNTEHQIHGFFIVPHEDRTDAKKK